MTVHNNSTRRRTHILNTAQAAAAMSEIPRPSSAPPRYTNIAVHANPPITLRINAAGNLTPPSSPIRRAAAVELGCNPGDLTAMDLFRQNEKDDHEFVCGAGEAFAALKLSNSNRKVSPSLSVQMSSVDVLVQLAHLVLIQVEIWRRM